MNAERFLLAVFSTLLGAGFVAGYVLTGPTAWVWCLCTSVLIALAYFWTNRRNLLCSTTVFVVLSTVANTMPVLPYLLFDLEQPPYLADAIVINTVGLFFFVAAASLTAPLARPRAIAGWLRSVEWDHFYRVNALVLAGSLPFVFLAITMAGAWGAFAGLQESGFDRIASLKGLGALMVFSFVNVLSALFVAIGPWLKGRRAAAAVLLVLVLYINGFTYGRGNVLPVFFACGLLYYVIRGATFKLAAALATGGLLILFAKMLRAPQMEELDAALLFLLNFSGFDSINNTAVLAEYLHRGADYFGLYHIWSTTLIYIPRGLFPDKPQELGALVLNGTLFPGVYLGAEGGTGLSLGNQAIWYAAYGFATLIPGNLLTGWVLARADRLFCREVRHGIPSLIFVAYLVLIGQSVILYREGIVYALMNVLFYSAAYASMYALARHAVRCPGIASGQFAKTAQGNFASRA